MIETKQIRKIIGEKVGQKMSVRELGETIIKELNITDMGDAVKVGFVIARTVE